MGLSIVSHLLLAHTGHLGVGIGIGWNYVEYQLDGRQGDEFLEAGFNAIDTADVYSRGFPEASANRLHPWRDDLKIPDSQGP